MIKPLANTNTLWYNKVIGGIKHMYMRIGEIKNIEELKEAFPFVVAAYRDYWHYTTVLYGVEEDFDESLEHFDSATWISMSKIPAKADELTVDCVSLLRETSSAFEEIAERAKENLAVNLKAVMLLLPTEQKILFDKAYKINPETIDAEIEGLLTILDEEDYHHSVPENFKTFLKVMEEVWSKFLV
jgi:tetratricopeptide (TPR) repeat protein